MNISLEEMDLNSLIKEKEKMIIKYKEYLQSEDIFNTKLGGGKMPYQISMLIKIVEIDSLINQKRSLI